MTRLFNAIGRVVVRRRGIVFVAWAGLLLFGLLFAPRLHEVFARESMAKGAGEAQEAADFVASDLGGRSAYQQQLVLTSDSFTVDDARYVEAAGSISAAIEKTALVTSVESYFTTGDRKFVAADGRTTYALLNLRSKTHADGMTVAGDLLDLVKAEPKPAWLKAHVTGLEASHADLIEASSKSMRQAEMVGIPVALMVLVFVFGTLVVAGIPLLMGVFSILIALALAFVVGQWVDLNLMTENLAAMIGLGVGIDYSLFMLSRYRSERNSGRSVDAAVVETVSHAGKAIAFAGFTVVIGLSSLLATGDAAVGSMGIGGILVVLVAVAAAVTLLPAALSLLGDRIEKPRWMGRLIAHGHRSGFWGRWASRVMRRPIAHALLGTAVIGTLAWPALTLKTGSTGVVMLPGDAQSRMGFDVLAREFGPGVMSPVQIVVHAETGIDDPAIVAGIDQLTRAIQADGRFAGATSLTTLVPGADLAQYQALYANRFEAVPPAMAGALKSFVDVGGSGRTTVVLAFLREDPGADSSRDAVRVLRNQIIPAAPELQHARVVVGGYTALEMDQIAALYSRFPLVIGLILGATFVLLMVLFRSILIPLKAVVMNLLSVAASYGLLVLVFQHGIGDTLLGFDAVGSVNSMTPVLVFAVLFGLSMDYEVFLMSRIRELHDQGYSNEASVAAGLERTGGVITGAALIMIVAFAAFALSPIVALKEIGFALAVAVFLDATVIRIVLVPALMRLFGNWNWWLPPFLARLLPSTGPEQATAVAGD